MNPPLSISDIEQRLRTAAPDEPAVLPALLLPMGVPPQPLGAVLGIRRQSGHAERTRPLVALVALTALFATLVVAGALRLLQPPTPINQLKWPPAEGVLGVQDGFSMSWPPSWHRLAEGGLEQGDFTQEGIAYERVAIILANVDLPGCVAEGATDGPNAVPSGEPLPHRTPNPLVACLRSAVLPPDGIRVTVEVGERSAGLLGWGGSGPSIPDTSEPTAETGWTEQVDGQPARMTVVSGADAAAAGASESLTWDVIFPGTIGHVLRFRADLGPGDLDAARAAARDVLATIDFDTTRPDLDPAVARAQVANAIDGLDRDAVANYGSDFYTCMPRDDGTATGTITSSPWQPLPEPVAVTCTTAIAPSRTGLWRATLTVRWSAGTDYPAGGIRQELFVGADGPFQTPGNFIGIDSEGSAITDGSIPLPGDWGEVVPGPADPTVPPTYISPTTAP